MAANFRFISLSAEPVRQKFRPKAAAVGLPRTCFAHAGWTKETEDRAVPLWIEFTYRQIFDQPLLNFFQIVVIAIKDLLRLIEIEIVVTQFVPWQIGNDLDVTHDH